MLLLEVEENVIGGIEKITVKDDGDGIRPPIADAGFSQLGSSWKKSANHTVSQKRKLHGKDGKGRFRAFALGNQVRWDTCYMEGSDTYAYGINGNKDNLKLFRISAPVKISNGIVGTEVGITAIRDSCNILHNIKQVSRKLTEEFALYLKDYRSVSIKFRGELLDPSSVISNHSKYLLRDLFIPGGRINAVVEIVEWSATKERKICLCNEDGFTLCELEAGIRPGKEFNFAIYVCSDHLRELHKENRLVLYDSEPSLKIILEKVRDTARTHFREKKSEAAKMLVQQWKEEGIYPYVDDSDIINRARRQVFDICAFNIHEFLADFRDGDSMSRKFTFRMLKQALEDSPGELQKILNEVLCLPENKQKELAELLNKTTLSAIIEACALVAQRIEFLKGLEELLFDERSKKELLERSQLHKILEEETWIFGEEYSLTSSDETLTTVLKKHLKELRPEGSVDQVLREDGSRAVIDLMLARSIPCHHKNKREYLVIELKRPSQKIDLKVKGQIESYALAVSDDERFDKNNVSWTFIAVSNDMSDKALKTIDQEDKPYGVFHNQDNVQIGLATWAEILQKSRTRLELYREKLDYEATADDGLELLRTRYEKYMPSATQDEAEPSASQDEAEPSIVIE